MGKNKNKTRNPSSKKSTDDRDYLLERDVMNNPRFSAYYKAQKIVPEAEWEAFLNSMRQHLPTTFRVAGSRQTAESLNSMINEVYVPALSGDIEFEGQRIPPPVKIPWYPGGLAWQFNVPKKVLRKQEEFKKFHSFLVFETEIGNISRQEAVSMLPPLFLEVQPYHKVLDMCAAPGSKTAQILEALHANDTVTSSSIPTGLLVANDSDHKRTHLLIHQSARLPSPALMVTNLDASNYPVIKIPTLDCVKPQQLHYDRILCDVPCSGDGTMRKNIGIWKSWQPGDGNGLHSLQVRILQRAMKLLEKGGRIVYSTCSLNPVENEAVISAALNANSEFELVDVSAQLPELKTRPGLTTWRPTIDRNGEVTYETLRDFLSASIDPALKEKLSESHWPPKNAEVLCLHRCLRIYPHLQDTGGFFIAVLERQQVAQKVGPGAASNRSERKREAGQNDEDIHPKKLRLDPEVIGSNTSELCIHMDITVHESEMQELDNPENPGGVPPAKQSNDGTFKENPYTFLRSNDPVLRACIERLHLTADFPASNILVRNPEGEPARSLYLANGLVKSIIENNDYKKIRLTAAGTKVMSKQEAGKGLLAQFRVLGEGLPVLLPFIEYSTIIASDLNSLKILLTTPYPLISTFDVPFRERIQDCPMGSLIIKLPPGCIAGGRLAHELVLPIWKSNVSLTLMIDKRAKSALSLRLFNADVTLTRGKVSATALPAHEDARITTAEKMTQY